MQILKQAAIADVQAVILALNADSTTLFATVIFKDLAPNVPVIARVNRAENVERIYAAGADFALSISQVSGQLLAWRLLGKESVAFKRAKFGLFLKAGATRISPGWKTSKTGVYRGRFGGDIKFRRGTA
jgi:Trk K+ transport system NAD-binding subunit